MDKFQRGSFQVQEESSLQGEQRVLKLDAPVEQVVGQYQFGKLRAPGEGTYQRTREIFGPVAPTDSDRQARDRKDARFQMNPLLREPLSVEEEERRAIEERVQERLNQFKEVARKEGRLEGFEEGKKLGFEEAFRVMREESQERLATFDALLSSMEKAKNEIFLANEAFLIELVFRVGKLLALKDLSTDPGYVLRLSTELIQKLGIRDNITLRVNAKDFESAGMIKEGLDQALGKLNNLKIEASSEIELGGCIVETDWNAMDARLESQLNGIHQSLTDIQNGSGTPS